MTLSLHGMGHATVLTYIVRQRNEIVQPNTAIVSQQQSLHRLGELAVEILLQLPHTSVRQPRNLCMHTI